MMKLTQRGHCVFGMVLKVITSSCRLVMKFDVDYIVRFLIRDIDHTNHVEGFRQLDPQDQPAQAHLDISSCSSKQYFQE